MYLAHRPVTTIAYKMSVVISSKCTWTIGDPKPARTSLYYGTEPVILLRPEDMRTSPNHQYYTVTLFTLRKNNLYKILHYIGLSNYNISRLQSKMKTADRSLRRIPKFEHITETLGNIHRLLFISASFFFYKEDFIKKTSKTLNYHYLHNIHNPPPHRIQTLHKMIDITLYNRKGSRRRM